VCVREHLCQISIGPGSVAWSVIMRKSVWTPSIAPNDDDQNVYLVVDDFGRNGPSRRGARAGAVVSWTPCGGKASGICNKRSQRAE
jgi:hypothetical protein